MELILAAVKAFGPSKMCALPCSQTSTKGIQPCVQSFDINLLYLIVYGSKLVGKKGQL